MKSVCQQVGKMTVCEEVYYFFFKNAEKCNNCYILHFQHFEKSYKNWYTSFIPQTSSLTTHTFHNTHIWIIIVLLHVLYFKIVLLNMVRLIVEIDCIRFYAT